MRADLIREARKRAGLTQRELADEGPGPSGCSRCRRESGSTATPGSSRPPATWDVEITPEASPANLDIALTSAGSTGYGSLVAGAAVIDFRDIPVQLAGLADVVDSTANRPKDQRALPVLRELLAAQTRARAGRPRP